MKNLAVGLLSAAALATTILLVRQQREVGPKEGLPKVSLERIRELGL